MTPAEIESQLMQTPEGVWVLKNDTHLSRWIEEHKRLDIAEGQIEPYAKYIPKGGSVVDAGACLGDHTATYAKLVGPEGFVHAFEPHPVTFEALKRNMASQKNVGCVEMALTNQRGTVSFLPNKNAGASHVGNHACAIIESFDNVGWIDVDAIELDEFDGEFKRLDFVHFDLEGFEADALQGARGLIARFKPVIVIEVNHGCLERRGLRSGDLYKVLAGLGYRWEEIEPHHNEALPQRDIICFSK